MVKVASARFLHSDFTVPSFIIKGNLCGDTWRVCKRSVSPQTPTRWFKPLMVILACKDDDFLVPFSLCTEWLAFCHKEELFSFPPFLDFITSF